MRDSWVDFAFAVPLCSVEISYSPRRLWLGM
jgi:hypothetical protein